MNPLISIIIPVYNVEKYLRECLDSVLSQSCSEYEVICVNDGSTDGSLTILKEYAKKIDKIQIIDQKNNGLSGARNAGINEANGDYNLLLDSDDWIEQNTIEILKKHIDGQDVLCFNGRRFFEDGSIE